MKFKSILVTVTPNLENLLKNEITSIYKSSKLPLPKLSVINGGVEIELKEKHQNEKKHKTKTITTSSATTISNNDDDYYYYLWSISNCSRLAESIRIRIGDEFKSNNFNQLISQFEQLPQFECYFPTSNIQPQLSISSSSSTLYHTNAIKERFLQYFNQHIINKITVQPSQNEIKQKQLKKLLKNLKYNQRKQEYDKQLKNDQDYNYKIQELQNELDQLLNKQQQEVSGGDQKDEILQTKVFIRIENNMVQCSVDAVTASGQPLFHKRTPDKHITDAPIRETLASAIIQATGYNGNTNLWDPFVGSGTIIQETLSSIFKVHPSSCTNFKRSFQFERFTNHQSEKYLEYLNSIMLSKPYISNLSTIKLIGSDIDGKAIESSKHNLGNLFKYNGSVSSSSDIENNIQFLKGDFESIYKNIESISKSDGGKPFTIITNLPYGARVLHNDEVEFNNSGSGSDNEFYLNNNLSNSLKSLFKRFGTLISKSDPTILKDVFVLNGNSHFQSLTTNNGTLNFEWNRLLHFKNGGLSVELLKLNRKINK